MPIIVTEPGRVAATGRGSRSKLEARNAALDRHGASTSPAAPDTRGRGKASSKTLLTSLFRGPAVHACLAAETP